MKRWTSVDESMIYPGGEFNGTPYSLWRCEGDPRQMVMILEVNAPESGDVREAVLEVARQEIREIYYGRRQYAELSVGIAFLDEVFALHSIGARKGK